MLPGLFCFGRLAETVGKTLVGRGFSGPSFGFQWDSLCKFKRKQDYADVKLDLNSEYLMR